MNDTEILYEVRSTLSKMHTRDNEKDYQFLIDFLVGIAASREAKEDSAILSIERGISILKSHRNLAIVKQGNICELDCWLAARHNITTASNACGGMFPVMSVSDAMRWLEDGILPKRGLYDLNSGSIVTEYLYYKRNPDKLHSLSVSEVRSLNLQHLMS